MSDDTQPPQPPSPVPPSPLGKTQAVPLKKETVRITLRAKPGEGGEGAPAAPPTAPLRPAAPPPAVARPAAPPPPAGAVGSRTIPLSPAPSPAAPRAPGAAPAATPASPAPARPMTTPLSPAQSAPGPRPTVRLQPQQGQGAAASTISSAPLKPAVLDDDEAETDEKGFGLLTGIATALAALFLIVAALGSDSMPLGVSLDQKNAGWKIPRPSPLNSEGKAKEDYAQRDATGSWSSDLELAEIPQYDAPK